MSRKRKSAKDRRPRAASATAEPQPRGPSRARRYALITAAAILLTAMLIFAWSRRPERAPIVLPPPVAAAPSSPDAADFAGDGVCADCHRAQHDAWRLSTHGRAGGEAAPDLVIAPFNGRPIRFLDAIVIPERNADGDYIFTIARAGRPGAVLRVDGVVGGAHMVGGGTQGFVTRHRDGTYRFLPFDWSRQQNAWFCNTGTRSEKGWQPITPQMPLADCGDWPPTRVLGSEPRFQSCQQCHGSRIELELGADGQGYETRFATLRIDCESCHGPAREHVQLARAGALATAADPRIGVLGALAPDASLQVCFQCHALKDGLQPGYVPGADLEHHYSLALPLLCGSALHADGRVRSFAYQETHLFSECYRNGAMTCVDCHDPHAQGYRDAFGARLESRFADRQCTACHPSKAADVVAHTRHPAASPGSACVSCHMPYLQHPEVGDSIRFARSDHTIPVPRPAHEAALGIESACVQCHRDRSATELQRQTEAWWGEPKPWHPTVAALLSDGPAPTRAAAVRALLEPAPGHRLARYYALAVLFESHLRLDEPAGRDVEAALRELAEQQDTESAALALAALHLTRGRERATRRFLADALAARAHADRALRLRWAVALGFLGDRLVEQGAAASAVRVYERALEVLPRDPRLLDRTAHALAAGGDAAAAIAYYQQSLQADPRQPLVLVNLGIAYAAVGDAAAAANAYDRALRINPYEPLAHFNLGNLRLRGGDAGRAAEAYARARELDPANAAAHLNHARALIMLGQLESALEAVEAGLEFAPGDAAAAQMRADLVATLRATR